MFRPAHRPKPTGLHPRLAKRLARLGLAGDGPACCGERWRALLKSLDVPARRASGGRRRLRTLREQAASLREEFSERLTRSEGELALARARLASQLELSADWMWEQDAELRFTYVSEGIEAVAGIAPARLIGRKREFNPGFDMSAEAHAIYTAAIAGRRPYRDIVTALTRPLDGSRRYVRISGEPIFDAQGRFQGYRGASRDVTEAVLAERKIQQLARYDGLTGLPNRNMFLSELEAAIVRCRRRGETFALCFIDLDRFKTVNDTLGHDAGDELLRIMAARLRASVRSTDLVARLGGDEFVMLLEASGGPIDVARMAHKVLAGIGEPVPLQGLQFLVTGSIGISLYPADGTEATALLKNADAAMYLAKARGKNNVQFYTSALADEAVRTFTLETELRQALDRDEWELHYQPVVELASGALQGVEALLRWVHPGRGLVAPGEFIAVAEERGLILPIGRWVLGQACRQIGAWREARLAVPTVSINLSARQFADDGLVESVVDAMRRYRVRAGELAVELTESTLMTEPERAGEMLARLAAAGVAVAIDDFGTGYSSLAYLKRFAARTIKIDRSFVSGLPEGRDDLAITQAVIAMAHTLGMKVVAEGVETEAQRALLAGQGCDGAQGWLFGRPMPQAQFAQWMQSRCNQTRVSCV